MHIQLSDHFTYKRLLRFTAPSIAMMIFTSIYGVVDGYFVSNFAGTIPFAAVNLIMPFLMIVATVGFVFGTGGTAMVAMAIGEGNRDKANRLFSLFVYVAFVCGLVFAVLGIVLIRPVSVFLGAEKPQLGFKVTLAAGVTNMALDALLVGLLPQEYKLIGAASATAISQTVGGVVPLVYFFRPNDSLLRLGKTAWNGTAVGKACFNGSSEFMNNISMSVVAMLYNRQLIAQAGENGVAAYGVMMYVSMIFAASFIGYSIGVSPVFGFHHGAGNPSELKSLLRKSLLMVGICGLLMVALAQAAAWALAYLFVGYDAELMQLTVKGFRVFALSFACMGFGIFGSGLFTALGDGLTSALISFLRTLVFQSAAVLLLSHWFGIDGIWWAVVVAEALAVGAFAVMLFVKRKTYRYW